MGGVEFVDDELVVGGGPPNELDELAIPFSGILDDLEIRHVFVAGDVARRPPD